jgi:hypothetical protein
MARRSVVDPTRWWFEPDPTTGDVRSVLVLDFQETHDGDQRVPPQGTIKIELLDAEAREWAKQLGRVWRIRGGGTDRVVRLNGPLSTWRTPTGADGLPEIQVWRWESAGG